MIHEAELVADIRAAHCPDCYCCSLKAGHRTDLMLDLECATCGAKFRAGGAVMGLRHTFSVERLGNPMWPRRAWRKAARDTYHDPNFEPRKCDRCDLIYTGPAPYCSLACAETQNATETAGSHI